MNQSTLSLIIIYGNQQTYLNLKLMYYLHSRFQHVFLRNYLNLLGFVNVYEGIKYTTGHLPMQTEYIARIIILADNYKFKRIDPLVKIFCVEDEFSDHCLGKMHLFVLNLPACVIICILIRRETEYMVTIS